MGIRDLTFPGGIILGAGLMYLLDPERTGRNASGLHCIAGALGVAAMAYGAKLIAQREDPSTSTALDLDMPNYVWLR
jgi:hypothetical protein